MGIDLFDLNRNLNACGIQQKNLLNLVEVDSYPGRSQHAFTKTVSLALKSAWRGNAASELGLS